LGIFPPVQKFVLHEGHVVAEVNDPLDRVVALLLLPCQTKVCSSTLVESSAPFTKPNLPHSCSSLSIFLSFTGHTPRPE